MISANNMHTLEVTVQVQVPLQFVDMDMVNYIPDSTCHFVWANFDNW